MWNEVHPRIRTGKQHVDFAQSMRNYGSFSDQNFADYMMLNVPPRLREEYWRDGSSSLQGFEDLNKSIMRASFAAPTNNEKIIHGMNFQYAPNFEKEKFAHMATQLVTVIPHYDPIALDKASRDNYNFVIGTQRNLMNESINRWRDWNAKHHPPCFKC